MTIAPASPIECDDALADTAGDGFQEITLSRSGRRPARLRAALIWSGAAETRSDDQAIVRHEARLLVDETGAPYLHIYGERRVDGEAVAWRACLASAEDGLSAALAAYDPSRLVGGFDLAARALCVDASALEAFAEEAARVKADLVALIESLGRPQAPHASHSAQPSPRPKATTAA